MLTDPITPHVVGLVPAAVVGGLPNEIESASAALGLQPHQLVAHREGAFQADLDVPRGIWRYWPTAGAAIWIARSEPILPPLPPGSSPEKIDLLRATTTLHEAGHWVAELSLRLDDGWGPPLRLRDALEVLTDPSVTVLGISGYWSDNDGAARVEIYEAGQVWADSPLRAERFLLVATGRES